MSPEVTSPAAEPISEVIPASQARETKETPASALPAPRRTSWLSLAGQWVAILVLAAACYFFFSHFFLQSVRVIGISMVPTLQDSQRYLLNRWVLFLRAPHRDDIVVLRDPSDNGYSVKRVVGVAGDSVEINNGRLYVNGVQLQEPYLTPGTPTFPSPTNERHSFTCSKNEFFVLGDNRPRSIDSRVYGPVPRANILGLIIH